MAIGIARMEMGNHFHWSAVKDNLLVVEEVVVGHSYVFDSKIVNKR